jgi:hypothetical protein
LDERGGGVVTDDIRFDTVTVKDDASGSERVGIEVIRDGRRVAVLPGVRSVDMLLNQPLEMVEHIALNIGTMTRATFGRDPSPDEIEFWRAVLDSHRLRDLELRDESDARDHSMPTDEQS